MTGTLSWHSFLLVSDWAITSISTDITKRVHTAWEETGFMKDLSVSFAQTFTPSHNQQWFSVVHDKGRVSTGSISELSTSVFYRNPAYSQTLWQVFEYQFSHQNQEVNKTYITNIKYKGGRENLTKDGFVPHSNDLLWVTETLMQHQSFLSVYTKYRCYFEIFVTVFLKMNNFPKRSQQVIKHQ